MHVVSTNQIEDILHFNDDKINRFSWFILKEEGISCYANLVEYFS